MLKDVKPSPNSLNDDQESMQALRRYGGYIILAMLLALAGYFGWRYWQMHGGRIDQAAANDFVKIQLDQTNLANLNDKNPNDATTQQQLKTEQTKLATDLDNFIEQHDNSIYTWQALMQKAKLQADNNDFKAAIVTIQRAQQLKIGDAGLEAITTLRYAQALIANNQLDAAQKALQAPLPEAFHPSQQELLGDIAMAKQDKNGAINHYQQAWQLIEARNQKNDIKQDRAILRVKMENVGLSPKQPDLSGGVLALPAQPSAAPNHANLAANNMASASGNTASVTQ